MHKKVLPWSVRGILKIFRIPLKSGKQVHECDTWQQLKLGHRLVPTVEGLPKRKRLSYPYRTWPGREHPCSKSTKSFSSHSKLRYLFQKNNFSKNHLQLVEYIRFELEKDAQNHSQQLHVAIQAYKVTKTRIRSFGNTWVKWSECSR